MWSWQSPKVVKGITIQHAMGIGHYYIRLLHTSNKPVKSSDNLNDVDESTNSGVHKVRPTGC